MTIDLKFVELTADAVQNTKYFLQNIVYMSEKYTRF